MPRHNVKTEINEAPDKVVDFKALGIKADVIAESTSGTGVTLDGILLKDSEVTTDVINEKTAATGVTIDSVLLKDNVVTATLFDGIAQSNSTTSLQGYATGAGGAIVQGSGSGKATAVTLSRPCGQITTDNAALAAAAEVTFTVTNTNVSLQDVIILSIQSGGTSGEYLAHVTDVGAGTFDITLANMSAGSISDVVIINFAVLNVVKA